MEHKIDRLYKLKKLTYPKWKWKLFIFKERLKKVKNKLSNKKVYHKRWFEFSTGWSGFAFAYQEAGYDSRPHIQIYLFWGHLFIYTSQKRKEYIKGKFDERDERKWGITYYSDGNSFIVYYGHKNKFIYMPWAKDWHRSSLLMKDGTWVHEYRGNRKNFWDDDLWDNKKFKEIYPYTYRLKSGKNQNVDATICVEEREWIMKFLKWTKLFNTTRKTIDVTFSSEIGERSGSWKGGVIGCGYEIMPNETPYDTLKRMERERKFK